MSLEALISTYGYAAIAAGSFLEGETVVILGGFAAHRGYLELPWVIAFAFAGTFFGDQLYYHLGRTRGKVLLEKRPDWKSKSEKVFQLLDKHRTWFILGFRFLYGLRTITPFLIGISEIPRSRFIILNMFGAFVWAFTVGILGYFLGNTLEMLLGDIRRYELMVFLVLILFGILLWLFNRYRK